MSAPYFGFSADLGAVLFKMQPLTEEFGGDWKAAAAVVPTLDAKVRDQLAVEHLVHCYRRTYVDGYAKMPKPRKEQPRPSRAQSPQDARVPANRTMARLAQLNVTSGQVKDWAVRTELLPALQRGQVGIDVVEAYALAHPADR